MNITAFYDSFTNVLNIYALVILPSLVQIWLVAWSAPSHYLNQCWNIVNWALRNKLQWNSNLNSNIFIHKNAIESVVCEMATILSWPQCFLTECTIVLVMCMSSCDYDDTIMISWWWRLTKYLIYDFLKYSQGNINGFQPNRAGKEVTTAK